MNPDQKNFKGQSGLLQTLFNYGSLVFMLSGSSNSDVIDLVPRPEYQYKKNNAVKLELQAKHMTVQNGDAKMAG